MTVEAVRTYDSGIVKDVMTTPALWATIAEDGQDEIDFEPEVREECWLLMLNDEVLVGVYNIHALNSVTLEIHAHVLPEYRKPYSKATGYAALKWIYENASEYKKVIAQIPTIYENVKCFTCSFGFKEEGINRLSYLKNGEIVDQWFLGITRDEIEKVLNHEQSC